jgi:hypothetical protein
MCAMDDVNVLLPFNSPVGVKNFLPAKIANVARIGLASRYLEILIPLNPYNGEHMVDTGYSLTSTEHRNVMGFLRAL